DRTRFTLDETCARAVRHTLFKLFKDGLIVRGKRLVNWDTHLQTAVADDEVYHEAVKGHFYHFKYPVIDPQPGEPEYVHIATTRPETMLGDTAVAVHPKPDEALNTVEDALKQQLAEANEKDRPAIQAQLDELADRRKTLLPTLVKLRDMAIAGRKLRLPLVGREIPLICDEWAKPELGSGCVKITPAHDPNDYEVGQRHRLPMVNVMTPDGRVADLSSHSENPTAKAYEGLKFATEGRKKVVADLEALGLVEKIEDRVIDVGHSDRSKTAIEPFLSDQWFIKMGDLPTEQASKIEGLRGKSGLAQLAMDAVAEEPLPTPEARRDSGKVYFFPGRYRKTYLDWLGEKRDWCISRQLWWGHRIPIFRAKFSAEFATPHPEETRKKREEALDRFLDSLSTATQTEGDYCVSWVSAGTCYIAFRTEKAHDNLDTLRESLGVARIVSPEDKDDASPTPIPEGDPLKPFKKPFRKMFRLQSDFHEDPDVLDTWFSSALWPHSTLGWPTDGKATPGAITPDDAKKLLDRYYPGSVLSTAREIITLWVARMVLTGLYNIGKVPFHDVYIHAVIQDGQGRPFKKTLGNGFDPVDIIEVYGADALRFTMASLTTETQDIRMPMKKIKLDDGRELQSSERFELGRNFCNKLWNASRFAFMNLSAGGTIASDNNKSLPALDIATLPIEDRWILSQTSRAVVDVQNALLNFQFSRAIMLARDFFWDVLCDWYVELVKPRMAENAQGRKSAEARQVLAFVLDQSLRLLHPFVPYITEVLWKYLNEIAPQRGLPGVKGVGQIYDAQSVDATALVISNYPPIGGYPALLAPEVDAVFADLQTATRAVREIRQSRNVPPKQSVDVSIKVPADRVASLQQEAHVIQKLANVGTLTIGAEVAKPINAATLIIGDMQIFVANVIDAAAERVRLEKEQAAIDKQIAGIESKLANEKFVSSAPANVVASERERLAELQAKRQTVVQAMTEGHSPF
ncbi:MAG: class I tRNA ligase family protein, partial [Phycisphaerae bacterium]|nr:class I tRNA ligase family protein [Phycisphaerae bacterium]